jgi:hypothetical protein
MKARWILVLLLFWGFPTGAFTTFEELRLRYGWNLEDHFFFPVGWPVSDRIGVGEAIVHEDHLELKISVAFYGVGYFSRVAKLDPRRSYPGYRRLPYPADEFHLGYHATSFDQHPKLRNLLQNWQ